MLSYTGRRTLFGNLSNVSDTTVLGVADTLMNSSEKRILTMKPWPFLNKQSTLTTTASTQFTNLPQNVGKVLSVYVTVSSTRYSPKEAPSREFWDQLNYSTQTSDTPEYYYVFDGQLGLWPTPATSSNTITVNHRRVPKDLTLADYTTGSIVSVANGGTAVVGTGTSWTAKMAGLYLKITDSNTANTGDGFWYEIASSGTATTITLNRAYAGTAIAAGTAPYTIGQMSLLPEGYHELPVYDALSYYYASIQPEPVRAKKYTEASADLMRQLIRDFSSPTQNLVLDDGVESSMDNPNLHPRL